MMNEERLSAGEWLILSSTILVAIVLPIMFLSTCSVTHTAQGFDFVSHWGCEELCGKNGCYAVLSFDISDGYRTATVDGLRSSSVRVIRDGKKRAILYIEEITYWGDNRGLKSTNGHWIRENGTIVGNVYKAELHV